MEKITPEPTNQEKSPQTICLDEFEEYIVQKALTHPFPQTEFQCEHFVAGSHATKYRQVRQVLLEISTRKHALDKLNISLRKTNLELSRKESEIEKCEDSFDKELLIIERDDLLLDVEQWNKRIVQANMEIKYFLDYIKRNCGTVDEANEFFELNAEEEHKYWIARMAKQTSVDLLAYGRVGAANIDSILMMSDADQAKTLNAAIRYAGAIDSGMERMKLSAEAEIKYMEGEVPAANYFEELGEQSTKKLLSE